jgi:hypothetical protein
MPKAKKSSKEWKAFYVKDKATDTRMARVGHAQTDSTIYAAFKAAANVVRNGTFGHRQESVGGKISRAFASGSLRRRRAGAKRESLADVDVLNPSHAPSINNKSHLLPDVFGGPSTEHNLINEERSINLSGHKKIENRIGHFMELAATDKSPLKRRGSMVVVDSFDASGAPTGREYHVHTDAGNGQAERFDKFVIKHS